MDTIKRGIAHGGRSRWRVSLATALLIGTCATATAQTLKEICTAGGKSVTVDTSGTVPVGPAIQTCINATPDGGTLTLPNGTLLIDQQVVIKKPISIRVQGAIDEVGCFDARGDRTKSPCTTLKAAYNLVAINGILNVSDTKNVTISHIHLNGNRAERLKNPQIAEGCKGSKRELGINSFIRNCTNCAFVNGGATSAPCASGFIWNGINSRLEGNLIADNGDREFVSDGVTTVVKGGIIARNTFMNNSDVQLILFSGPGVSVTGNILKNSGRMTSYAGLMLDNMARNNPDLGDYRGATFTHNYIDCNSAKLPNYYGADIGIVVGPYAAYQREAGTLADLNPIIGGSLSENVVSGCKQGVLMAGAGTKESPTNLDDTNVVLSFAPESVGGFTPTGSFVPKRPGSEAILSCSLPGLGAGYHKTSAFNAAPGTVFNYAPRQPAWTFFPWKECF